jgi:osmoprotectant transport system permease protein
MSSGPSPRLCGWRPESLPPLRDDRGAFPPYEAALVVRADALESHPGLRAALLELSGKFSHSAVARLTQDVDAKGRAPAEVAAEFLRQAGLNR